MKMVVMLNKTIQVKDFLENETVVIFGAKHGVSAKKF